MTEVWKSNPRKFCDYCKCWTADNRASIEFHERGKKHIENVRIRLEEISRKGKEDYDNKMMEGDYMKQMELAALEAYKKDIEQNPDFTGTKISELAKEKNCDITVRGKKQDNKINSTPSVETPVPVNQIEEKKEIVRKWYEAKSPEGYSYYWHKDTGESIWEVPTEGYVTLKEQKKESKKNKSSKEANKKSENESNKKSENNDKETLNKTEPNTLQSSSSQPEIQTKVKSKKHKHKDKNLNEPKIINNLNRQLSNCSTTTITVGPELKIQPYGQWSTIQSEESVDLQLPILPEREYDYPVSFKKQKVSFEQKTVSLGSKFEGPDDSISFKKRKPTEEKRNLMQRRDL